MRRAVRPTTNVSKLSFPLQLVVFIVSTALTIAASTYGIRSDIRDILTRFEMRAELDAAQARLQEERAAQLKTAIDATQRRQELLQYEVAALKEIILKIQAAQRVGVGD